MCGATLKVMRVEPFGEGDIVHVTMRGARGMEIVRDGEDRYRWLQLLYFLNDANHPAKWERDINKLQNGLHFNRPDHWPSREKLTDILSYCLMDNHFHLLLAERKDGGISKFMQGLAGSMTRRFNGRHGGSGSIFEGSYKSRTIHDDSYLRVALVYINVKNPFERFAGGIIAAMRNFEAAYEFALEYPFCSLADIGDSRESPIIFYEHKLLDYSPVAFRRQAAELMENRVRKLEHDERAKEILIEM